MKLQSCRTSPTPWPTPSWLCEWPLATTSAGRRNSLSASSTSSSPRGSTLRLPKPPPRHQRFPPLPFSNPHNFNFLSPCLEHFQTVALLLTLKFQSPPFLSPCRVYSGRRKPSCDSNKCPPLPGRPPRCCSISGSCWRAAS